VPAAGEVDRFPFLFVAASLCREEIFEVLLGHGASIHTPELLAYAVDGGGGRLRPSLAIVQRVLNEATHDTDSLTQCLRFACVSGNPEVVKLLIQRGGDVNGVDPQDKNTPLTNAIRQGRAEVVQVLLAAGADPTRPVRKENHLGELTGKASTLMDFAVRAGYPEIAKMVE
jgi:ankyrin repeat protein